MTKQKYIALVVGVAVLAIGTGFGLWIQAHNFHWITPVEFQKPLSVSKKILIVTTTQIIAPDPIPLNDNEKYLCTKFGDQCKIALQIQHLENGNEQCDRIHVNDNHTVDFGFMMINSVHLNSQVKVSDLIDCKKNIDIAYNLYKAQGWGIWSTYKLVNK